MHGVRVALTLESWLKKRGLSGDQAGMRPRTDA